MGDEPKPEDQIHQQKEMEQQNEKEKGKELADADQSEEAKAAMLAAKECLAKRPSNGVLRYIFQDAGALGVKLSSDVPPCILEVRDGTLAAKKVPRVPVGGIVVAINGFAFSTEENPMAIQALAKRPVTLDVKWPDDQRLPTIEGHSC